MLQDVNHNDFKCENIYSKFMVKFVFVYLFCSTCIWIKCTSTELYLPNHHSNLLDKCTSTELYLPNHHSNLTKRTGNMKGINEL